MRRHPVINAAQVHACIVLVAFVGSVSATIAGSASASASVILMASCPILMASFVLGVPASRIAPFVNRSLVGGIR